MKQYDWLAGDSAPEDYTMEVIQGDFIYPDGGSLYVPAKASLHPGWGTAASSHVVGPDLKPLPNRLDITFFSFAENQFYRGSFELPYEEIHELFEKGYDRKLNRGHITFSDIVVGIAPGGSVAVWVQGPDKTTEIFFGQAENTEVPWNRLTKNETK